MCHIHADAYNRPCSQNRIRLPPSLIHPEYPDRGIVEAVQNTRPSRKVIQLLRESKVSCVEYHAEYPTRHAKVCKSYVEWAHRVGGGYVRGQFGEAILVREEVKEGEED